MRTREQRKADRAEAREERQERREERREDRFNNKNYKVNVGTDGNISIKPTIRNKSIFKVDANGKFDNLDGVFDFKEIAKKRGNKYIYKVDKEDLKSISMYDKNKEAQEREKIRGGRRKRIGDTIVFTDDKVGEQIFNLIGGNADVEYGRLRYSSGNSNNIENEIWTSGTKGSVKASRAIPKMIREDVKEISHSHPYRITQVKSDTDQPKYEHSQQIPSTTDITSYKKLDKLDKSYYKTSKTPKMTVFHPWSYNSKEYDYTQEYNSKGLINDRPLDFTPKIINAHENKQYKDILESVGY